MQPRLDLAKFSGSGSYKAMLGLEASLAQSTLPVALKHMLKLRASQINGCAYCIDMHTKTARRANESEQRLYAVAAWHEAPFFDDKERAALALADAVTLISDEHVPREVWDEARAHFEPDELAQLVWAITVINAWNRIAITTRMKPATRSRALAPANLKA